MRKPYPIEPCDEEIFHKGVCIGKIYGYASEQIEEFVKRAADISGQLVDWHFFGGVGRILVLGDIDKATKAFYGLELDPENTDIIEDEINNDGL